MLADADGHFLEISLFSEKYISLSLSDNTRTVLSLCSYNGTVFQLSHQGSLILGVSKGTFYICSNKKVNYIEQIFCCSIVLYWSYSGLTGSELSNGFGTGGKNVFSNLRIALMCCPESNLSLKT